MNFFRPSRPLLSLLLLLGFTRPAVRAETLNARTEPDGPRLYLKSRTASPSPTDASFAKGRFRLLPGSRTALLQFTGPVRTEWKRAAEAAGVRLLHYIPDYGYIARGEDRAFRNAASLPFVRWIGPLLPEDRVSPSLPDSGPISVVVALESRGNVEALKGAAEGLGLEAEAGSPTLLRVRGDALAVRSLAQRDEVIWIDAVPLPEPMNDRSRILTGVNPVWINLGLHGEGQVVAIADTGLDTGNPATLSADFQGRVEQGFERVEGRGWADEFGHGTHVSGIILGQGPAVTGLPNPDSYAGVAPRAKLVVQGLKLDSTGYNGFPDDLNELFGQAYDAGARVHNDSWGDTSSPYGSYSMQSRQVDEFIWNHPDMTIVFAAGNDGSDSPTRGETPNQTKNLRKEPGDGRVKPGSLYAPGTTKNAITVGASEGNRPPKQGWDGYADYRWNLWRFTASPISLDYTSDNPEGMAPISSRGPTADGRIKPDLVAPGSNIISTASSLGSNALWGEAAQGYAYNGGTSMSAGFVTGAAALVRQWFMDRQGIAPSAALVKATLLNGAHDMSPGQYGTGTYREVPDRPNGVEGWGRVDVAGALQPPDPLSVHFRDDRSGLQTGEGRSWLLRVPVKDQPLRVMLAWSDYPAAANAAKALVNDLDLTVTEPDGTSLPGNGTEDRANNVEAVNLSGARAGVYRVTVSGYNVPNGPQPFAVAVNGATGALLLPGDANLDGTMDVADAVRVLRASLGLAALSEDETLAANFDRTGDSADRVDVRDAVAILRDVVGLP